MRTPQAPGPAPFDAPAGRLRIRPFRDADTEAVVGLWRACGLLRPWNDPYRDIERKRAVQPELFLVGIDEDADPRGVAGPGGLAEGPVVASAVAGYDGHRGWLYYLAVAPGRQRLGHGRALVAHVERLLTARGCPKLSLQVRSGNASAIDFYRRLGYLKDEAVGLGKRLIPDA